MKKKKILEIVNDHFRVAHHFAKREYNISNQKKTKQFVKNIKQLKSFFHLLDMQFKNGDSHVISRKMKLLYDYSEAVLALQFHLQNITSFCEDMGKDVPLGYFTRIEEEVVSWQKKTEHLLRTNVSFKDEEELIVETIPRELSTASIRKYLDYVVGELHNRLQSSFKDESVHEVKKLLEDLFNNWEYVAPFLLSKDEVINKKNLRSIIKLLNDYYYKCEDVALLKMYAPGLIHDEQKEILDFIEDKIQMEIESLESDISKQLKLVSASVKKRKNLKGANADFIQ